MSQQEIILELTGPLKNAAESAVITVSCDGHATLGMVLRNFIQVCPSAAKVLGDADRYRLETGPLPPGLLIVRDSVAIPSRLETPVSGGERLTLMPMISGG
jgi:hypothetical protein